MNFVPVAICGLLPYGEAFVFGYTQLLIIGLLPETIDVICT